MGSDPTEGSDPIDVELLRLGMRLLDMGNDARLAYLLRLSTVDLDTAHAALDAALAARATDA